MGYSPRGCKRVGHNWVTKQEQEVRAAGECLGWDLLLLTLQLEEARDQNWEWLIGADSQQETRDPVLQPKDLILPPGDWAWRLPQPQSPGLTSACVLLIWDAKWRPSVYSVNFEPKNCEPFCMWGPLRLLWSVSLVSAMENEWSL